jgi:hypothetical protein
MHYLSIRVRTCTAAHTVRVLVRRSMMGTQQHNNRRVLTRVVALWLASFTSARAHPAEAKQQRATCHHHGPHNPTRSNSSQRAMQVRDAAAARGGRAPSSLCRQQQPPALVRCAWLRRPCGAVVCRDTAWLAMYDVATAAHRLLAASISARGRRRRPQASSAVGQAWRHTTVTDRPWLSAARDVRRRRAAIRRRQSSWR